MSELAHVLWIGGPPGAGKTTVARTLARRHGLRGYNADSHTWEHRDRAVAADHPAAVRFESLAPSARTALPPADQFAMSLHHERGPMIADDLRALPSSPLIIAEGTPVAPSVPPPGLSKRLSRINSPTALPRSQQQNVVRCCDTPTGPSWTSITVSSRDRGAYEIRALRTFPSAANAPGRNAKPWSI